MILVCFFETDSWAQDKKKSKKTNTVQNYPVLGFHNLGLDLKRNLIQNWPLEQMKAARERKVRWVAEIRISWSYSPSFLHHPGQWDPEWQPGAVGDILSLATMHQTLCPPSPPSYIYSDIGHCTDIRFQWSTANHVHIKYLYIYIKTREGRKV